MKAAQIRAKGSDCGNQDQRRGTDFVSRLGFESFRCFETLTICEPDYARG